MKRKFFVPNSIGFIIMNTLLFSWAILMIYVDVIIIARECYNYKNTLVELFILFLFYETTRIMLSYKIHLRENEIKTYGDMLPKFERIQFNTNVLYKDIKSIDIIYTAKNSKNNDIKGFSSILCRLQKYLEFTLINKKKKRMCINFYRKKQVAKILEYININMKYHNNENTLNVEEIMKDWSNIVTYNPKKNSKNKDNENAKQQDQQENE